MLFCGLRDTNCYITHYFLSYIFRLDALNVPQELLLPWTFRVFKLSKVWRAPPSCLYGSPPRSTRGFLSSKETQTIMDCALTDLIWVKCELTQFYCCYVNQLWNSPQMIKPVSLKQSKRKSENTKEWLTSCKIMVGLQCHAIKNKNPFSKFSQEAGIWKMIEI